MKLSELYQIFSDKAYRIPNFVAGKKEDVKYDIDILANCYVKAVDEHDELLADSYFSALILRYWHMIMYYKNESTGVEVDEIFSWLCDGISKAMKYRGWLNDPKLLNNRRGAEICINKAIDSARSQFYILSNAQKRKQEFLSGSKVFLDSLEEREAESYLGVEDRSYPIDVEVVKSLLAKREYLDAVVVDLITNGNCVTTRLSISKLKDELSELNESYFDYFKRKYEVKNMNKIIDAVSKNKDMSRFTIKQLLKRLGTNPIIKDLHK